MNKKPPRESRRIGIIGLDHMLSVELTRIINKVSDEGKYYGYRVSAAYPHGTRDLTYRSARVPEYSEALRRLGVNIVHSIKELLQLVDCVIITSNDGRVHREQALLAIEAGKPVFIHKPLAGSWDDALSIYRSSKRHNTPVFSSSSLRFIDSIRRLDNWISKWRVGKILGAHTYSPAHFDGSEPDLLWNAINGIEMLFAIMGPGCTSVQRINNENYDYLIGQWRDGRIGTFRGARRGSDGFGGVVFGQKSNIILGGFEGFEPIASEIINFFEEKKSPVSLEETLEIMAFIIAADESKKNGGRRMQLRTNQSSGFKI
ncbi:Gfo/Idh/MocA family protein [Albibacterium indicum]|uniref:Gfo/Idh/MocA family protein n=1 Tax=Albibacterium indicum TaxID=2292082 RepID=UPI001300B9B8|nr:Gfo/Idh/MocA family oxidoreductase [Pedobacter indicus]